MRRNYDWIRATSRRPIIRNAASLFGSTVVTSLLGFVFWLLAAKLLSPTAVGRASALQSTSQLLSYVRIAGLGTLSIAELAESKTCRQTTRCNYGYRTATNGLIAGFGVGLALIYLSAHLRAWTRWLSTAQRLCRSERDNDDSTTYRRREYRPTPGRHSASSECDLCNKQAGPLGGYGRHLEGSR